jgi:hypothetical protein
MYSVQLNNSKITVVCKTTDIMFDDFKAFEIKLKSFKYDINSGICKYLIKPQKMTDLQIHDKPHIQNLQMQFPSITASTNEPVPSTFTAFRSFEETAKFIKCAM